MNSRSVSLNSVLRQPRAIIKINDIEVTWISAQVTTTTYYLADNFRIIVPLFDQPTPIDLNYWSTAEVFQVKIYIGFPRNPDSFTINDLDLMIVGNSDEIAIDLAKNLISFAGRDLTSLLIDNKTTQKFPNYTASQIAQLFADQSGLNPVITPTTTKVGVYYQNYQSVLTRELSQWDLLTFVAQQEDFIVFVQGNDLIFRPRPLITEPNPYIINYQPKSSITPTPIFNGTGLTLSRYLTLAADVIVKVRVPVSPLTGRGFTVKATSHHTQRLYIKGLPRGSNKPRVVTAVIPGLTREQALQRAQQILRDETIHEINFNMTLPGDNVLRKDSVLQLTGTSSALDQVYFADGVQRKITFDGGYEMEIAAKNRSVDTQVIF